MSYSSSMPKALSKQVHVLGGVYNLVHQALARLYFQFAKDLLALEEIISSLQKVKGEAQKEFEKVDGQIEYYLMFTSSRQAKLAQFLEELIKKVEDLHCQNSAQETIQSAFVEQGF